MTRSSILILTLLAVPAAAQQLRFDDVVRNLRNPDPEARMEALVLLRDAKHLEAIEPIAPLVIDPVDGIQLAAIETELSFYLVDEISGRRRVAFIIEVRSSGRAETAFAAGPLALWPRPVPAALLTNLLTAVDDESQKVRVEALYTFGAIAQPPLADAHAAGLIKALDHYDPAIRTAAARVIGRLKVAHAGEAVIKAVNDSQQPVRFAAMRALGEMGETSAVQALTQQLEHYRTGEGAWSALDGLARIGHPSSVPLFTARLTDRDHFLRRAAAEGLARASHGSTRFNTAQKGNPTEDRPSDPSTVAALENGASTDSSPMVRAAMAFALQKLGGDYVARLASALDSDTLAPQIAAYFLELGPPVAPQLTPHLKDPSESIRGNAALILGAIGGTAERDALQPLLKDRSSEVRRAAERAIERITLRGA
jgi:HEAT repeat protein